MRMYTSRQVAHTRAIVARGRDKRKRDGGADGHGKALERRGISFLTIDDMIGGGWLLGRIRDRNRFSVRLDRGWLSQGPPPT
jgi:hypothetical protein